MKGSEEIRKAQETTEWEDSPWSAEHPAASPYIEHYIQPDRPFYGRNDEFDQLDKWLADVHLPSTALLLANAGSGKSALIAKWYWKVSRSQASRSGQLEVVLLPISLRFQHAREQDVLPSLWAQLMQAKFETLPVPTAMTIAETRSKIRNMLAEDMECGRELLVIIDGLDEAWGWEFDSTVLPGRLGNGVRVLLASRVLADVDAKEWADRLQRTRKVDLYQIPLVWLSEKEVRAAAADWWGACDKLARQLGEALWLQTEGDPLVMNLILSSSDREEPPEVHDLQSLKPGLGSFFARWWEQQERVWGGKRLGTIGRTLFSVLSVAYEPLTRTAIVDLIKQLCPSMTSDDFDEALKSLKRFVVGNRDAYSLSHPRLADVELQRLTEEETRTIESCFLEWATSQVLERQVPNPYAVRHLGRHLVHARIDKTVQWEIVSLPEFRAACEQLDDWHDVFNENVKMATEACNRWIRRGSFCEDFVQALSLLVRLQLQRTAAKAIQSRLSATMTAHLLSHHQWTPKRALVHVLSLYTEGYQRVEALGIIAPHLDRMNIRLAMDAIGRELSHAFSEPESLGVWPVSLRACELLDRLSVVAWARSIPGLGSAVALTAIATQFDDDSVKQLLADAIKSFIEADLGGMPVAFALGNLLSQHFSFSMVCQAAGIELLSDPVELVTRIGCRHYDTHYVAREIFDARFLRVAFPWLDDLEKHRRVARVTSAIKEATIREETTIKWRLFSDRDLRIEDVGALADVCDREQCKELFDLISDIVESPTGTNSHEHRQLFRTALRFAVRLSPAERYRAAWNHLLHNMSKEESYFDLAEFFEAAAALPELLCDLSEMVGVFLRAKKDFVAIQVLTSIAPYLSTEQLEAQCRLIEQFDPDLRDKAWRAISDAQVKQSQSDEHYAPQNTEKIGMTVEGKLFSLAVHGLSGTISADVFHAGYNAWRSLGDQETRTQAFSSLASFISLQSIDDVVRWVPLESRDDGLALSYALPHLPVCVLLTLPGSHLFPFKLHIHNEQFKVHEYDEQCVAVALQNLANAIGANRAMEFAFQCGEVTGHEEQWIVRGLIAISPLTIGTGHEKLTQWILEIADKGMAAQAAVVLGRSSARGGLPSSVECYLRELRDSASEHKAASVLELLSGVDLERALTLLDVDTAFARRGKERIHSWVLRACRLIPWVSLTSIHKTFFASEFRFLDVGSDEDRSCLRTALALRLFNTQHTDLALSLASQVIGSSAWRCHARMLAALTDPNLVEAFVRAATTRGDAKTSVAAMSRVMLHSVLASNPELAATLCAKILESAQNEGDSILYLSLITPVLWRLGIGETLTKLVSTSP
jgi:hypothetical protein